MTFYIIQTVVLCWVKFTVNQLVFEIWHLDLSNLHFITRA